MLLFCFQVGGAALRGRFAPAQRVDSLALTVPAPSPPLDTESLVLYFSNAVLPRFVLNDQSIPLDLNMVMQESLLQQAILAVSQAHHDMFLHATSHTSMLRRQQARHKAIQSLRQRLERSKDTDQEVFATNVLMCMLDGMIHPGEQFNASMFHLKGGYALLESNTPTNMLAKGGLQAHLLSLFVTMDLVHALLSGDRPHFEPLIWHMFANVQAWWGILPHGDRFLTFLKTLSELACLGHFTSHLPTGDGLRLIESCVQSLESTLTAQSLAATTEHADRSTSSDWDTFCSIFEISGLIYLHRALRLQRVDDEAVQAATRKGLDKLLHEELPGMMSHCLVLPLLIIGANCIHSQDRCAILQALSPTTSFLSFGNLVLMEEMLKEIWSKSDVQATWWETFGSVAERVFLF